MQKDIRTLCSKCQNDYRYAGYFVRIRYPHTFGRCDKCNKKGIDCIVREDKHAAGK